MVSNLLNLFGQEMNCMFCSSGNITFNYFCSSDATTHCSCHQIIVNFVSRVHVCSHKIIQCSIANEQSIFIVYIMA